MTGVTGVESGETSLAALELAGLDRRFYDEVASTNRDDVVYSGVHLFHSELQSSCVSSTVRYAMLQHAALYEVADVIYRQ
jgi:hypothetical protein